MPVIRIDKRKIGPLRYRLQPERGAQLLEFAFAVPILLLLVVGAWDVGSTIALKQKLTNAAREGARIAVSELWKTPSDCSAAPCAITDAENVVVLYLNNANVDASCISSATPATDGVTFWKWACSGSTASLKISTVVVNGVLNWQVTLTYPVRWITPNFMGLGPSSSTITTTVTMVSVGS